MSINALTGTEYATPDSRLKLGVINRFVLLWCHANGDYRILFYTANLTTAIDVTSTRYELVIIIKGSHGTVSNDDTCSTGWVGKTITVNANHSRLTEKGTVATLKGFTLTTTEHITCNRSSVAGRNRFVIHCACRCGFTNRLRPIPFLGFRVVGINLAVGIGGLSLTFLAQPFTCTNLHTRVALHITLITTTIDGADSTDCKNSISIYRMANHFIGVPIR